MFPDGPSGNRSRNWRERQLGGSTGGAAHLARIHGTEEDRVNCPFYFKIGACRHGDRCSRQHHRPPFSQTILVKHMWVNPQSQIAAAGGDPATLDDKKTQDDFDDFFEEVSPSSRRKLRRHAAPFCAVLWRTLRDLCLHRLAIRVLMPAPAVRSTMNLQSSGGLKSSTSAKTWAITSLGTCTSSLRTKKTLQKLCRWVADRGAFHRRWRI